MNKDAEIKKLSNKRLIANSFGVFQCLLSGLAFGWTLNSFRREEMFSAALYALVSVYAFSNMHKCAKDARRFDDEITKLRENHNQKTK